MSGFFGVRAKECPGGVSTFAALLLVDYTPIPWLGGLGAG